MPLVSAYFFYVCLFRILSQPLRIRKIFRIVAKFFERARTSAAGGVPRRNNFWTATAHVFPWVDRNQSIMYQNHMRFDLAGKTVWEGYMVVSAGAAAHRGPASMTQWRCSSRWGPAKLTRRRLWVLVELLGHPVASVADPDLKDLHNFAGSGSLIFSMDHFHHPFFTLNPSSLTPPHPSSLTPFSLTPPP